MDIKPVWFIILLIAGLAAIAFVTFFGDSRPNNEYELRLYPNYYILRDGDRVVDTIPFGSAPRLDSILLKDNR